MRLTQSLGGDVIKGILWVSVLRASIVTFNCFLFKTFYSFCGFLRRAVCFNSERSVLEFWSFSHVGRSGKKFLCQKLELIQVIHKRILFLCVKARFYTENIILSKLSLGLSENWDMHKGSWYINKGNPEA